MSRLAGACWTLIRFKLGYLFIHTAMANGVSSLLPTSVKIWCSLMGAERPSTRGGTSQKLGRNDRVWGGRGADRLWGGSTVSLPSVITIHQTLAKFLAEMDWCQIFIDNVFVSFAFSAAVFVAYSRFWCISNNSCFDTSCEIKVVFRKHF